VVEKSAGYDWELPTTCSYDGGFSSIALLCWTWSYDGGLIFIIPGLSIPVG